MIAVDPALPEYIAFDACATGPSGIAFINAALEAGHDLTIYARSPKKLSWTVLNKPNVKIVEGTFQDESAARQAVTSGAEALVSCAGPVLGNFDKGTPINDFYKLLYRLILSESDSKIKRCMILSTGSYPFVLDGFSLRWNFIVAFIATLGNFAYKEIVACSKTTASQPIDRLRWTLFRVPILTESAAGPVQIGYKGDGKDGVILSRKSLANWLVQELEERKYVGQAPMISDANWF